MLYAIRTTDFTKFKTFLYLRKTKGAAGMWDNERTEDTRTWKTYQGARRHFAKIADAGAGDAITVVGISS